VLIVAWESIRQVRASAILNDYKKRALFSLSLLLIGMAA
jgi:hypothetical protein